MSSHVGWATARTKWRLQTTFRFPHRRGLLYCTQHKLPRAIFESNQSPESTPLFFRETLNSVGFGKSGVEGEGGVEGIPSQIHPAGTPKTFFSPSLVVRDKGREERTRKASRKCGNAFFFYRKRTVSHQSILLLMGVFYYCSSSDAIIQTGKGGIGAITSLFFHAMEWVRFVPQGLGINCVGGMN